eukprot:9933217-Lingulodinium_polyedra.AAC.1
MEGSEGCDACQGGPPLHAEPDEGEQPVAAGGPEEPAAPSSSCCVGDVPPAARDAHVREPETGAQDVEAAMSGRGRAQEAVGGEAQQRDGMPAEESGGPPGCAG